MVPMVSTNAEQESFKGDVTVYTVYTVNNNTLIFAIFNFQFDVHYRNIIC